MKLNERLRQFRTAKQMTQAEVAKQLHLTRQTISGYESGRTEPDLETLKRLAEIYGVTLTELLEAEKAGGKTARRSLWILRGMEGVILLCALARSVLLWVANRFYAVPSGQMRPVLETRFAVTGAARGVESALLLLGWWLGIVYLVQSAQRSVPAKDLWKELGILAAGMLLVTVPWNLADPLFGRWNYCDVVAVVVCRTALLLLTGLLAGRLFRGKEK